MITGTGRVGFVGNNLVEALAGRYELYTPGLNVLDLTDYDAVSRYFNKQRIDIIVHCASVAKDILHTDLKMFFNLEKYSDSVEKMLYFGTGAELDKRFDICKAKEDDIGKRIPVDEYGLAKYIMNAYARRSDNVYNLRLFGIFGKYEDWTYKFISNLCCKAIFDLPLSIRRECSFDYIYIDDLPEVVAWFIENEPSYHDYNFASGKPILLTEIADMVLKVSGKKLDVVMLDHEGRNNEYTADNERLRLQLPRFEPTPIYEAIEKLYKWYYDNRDRVDIDTLMQTK